MNRREQNRLAQAATAMPDIPVELGTFTMRELNCILEALGGHARAYRGHPRADYTVAVGRKIIAAANAAEDAHLEAAEARRLLLDAEV